MRSVYRAKYSLKVFGFIFLAFSVFCSFEAWRGIAVGTNTWVDLAGGVLLVCAGAGIAVQTFTVCVVLSGESISCGSVFRKQSMQLNQIRYRREYEEYKDGPEGGINIYYLELVPHDGGAPSLKISKDDFAFDRVFWEWVYRIPDMEQFKLSN